MNEYLKYILDLFVIRHIPQFLYSEFIYLPGTIKVRDQIQDYQKIHQFDKIDFIINSTGGVPDDAYRIIKLLRNHFKEVNIIVPFYAKSSATLLTLGASNIILNELAELGPLDVQLRKEKDDSPEYDWESALDDEASLKRLERRAQELYLSLYDSITSNKKVRILRTEISKQIFDFISSFYNPLLNQIDPYKIGHKRRKLDIGSHYANKILLQYAPNLQAHKRLALIDYLVNECPDHGYIIDYELLDLFLPNVTKSTSVGDQYDDALTNLSKCFMTNDVEYIGFYPDIKSIIVKDGNMVLINDSSEGEKIIKEADNILKEEISDEKLN